MTKYLHGKVEAVQTKTIHAQVAEDSEADAIKQAKEKAQVNELGFYSKGVQLTFVGEKRNVSWWSRSAFDFRFGSSGISVPERTGQRLSGTGEVRPWRHQGDSRT